MNEIFASRLEGEDEFAMQQRQEADLVFATCYMDWVDKYFDDFEKRELRFAIANFNEGGNITYIYQLLARTKMLDDDQMDTIIDCLANRTLRTRLIVRLCTKDLLKCSLR